MNVCNYLFITIMWPLFGGVCRISLRPSRRHKVVAIILISYKSLNSLVDDSWRREENAIILFIQIWIFLISNLPVRKFALRIPALQTSIWMVLKFAWMYSKAFKILDSLRKSQAIAWIFKDAEGNCLFRSWRNIKGFLNYFLVLDNLKLLNLTSIRCTRRAKPITVTFELAKRSAIWAPIPDEAPVTSATLFCQYFE